MRDMLFVNGAHPADGQADFKYIDTFLTPQDVLDRIINPVAPPYKPRGTSEYEHMLNMKTKLIDNCWISESFEGVSSKEEALELLMAGWGEGAKMIRDNQISYEDLYQELEDATFTSDVTGSVVDMSAYLSGEPECMIMPVIEVRQTQGVRILCSITASWNISKAQMVARGLAISNVIQALNILGVASEVWVYSSVVSKFGTRTANFYLVKGSTDYLDLGQLAFMTAHPAMFRVIDFWMRDKARQEVQSASHIYKRRGLVTDIHTSYIHNTDTFKTLKVGSLNGYFDGGRSFAKRVELVLSDLKKLGINISLARK